jgi:hypothetical protein
VRKGGIAFFRQKLRIKTIKIDYIVEDSFHIISDLIETVGIDEIKRII